MIELYNVELSKYCTIGIGGVVSRMFVPRTISELFEALKICLINSYSYYILAGGSNTVFPDMCDNLDAVINVGDLKIITVIEKKREVEYTCESGVLLQQVVDIAQTKQLDGVTGLNRIPGTIGGAVFGNAGAYGDEIGNIVTWVEYIDIAQLKQDIYNNTLRKLSLYIHQKPKAECDFDYRSSWFKATADVCISRVCFTLLKSINYENETQKYNEISGIRDVVYPQGLKSPGSVFKNILVSDLSTEQLSRIHSDWIVNNHKIPVAKLLESTVGKGYKVGGVGNRDTHANIMINYSNGTQKDVIEYIQQSQKAIKLRFDIDIEPEIRVLC